MYVDPNYKTKSALKAALKAGLPVTVYSPGPFPCPRDGEVSVEGPHYPQPHTWYARVRVVGGKIVKIVG